jgi:hypothetical protein
MNILVLCTYPIQEPKHGGQLRVRNIADAYTAAGHKVQVRGVLGSAQYEAQSGFLPCPTQDQLTPIMANSFLMEDYAIGHLFAHNDKHYNQLAALISMRPECIHVEQPWLFAFAQRYMATHNIKAHLIYGSQNTESRLKKEIVASYMGDEVAQQHAQLIETVELQAITQADTVVCVSESDQTWAQARTKRPILLAPNGVKPWQSQAAGQKEANLLTQGHRYALYCASAHPPNMKGFFDIFGGGFGSLKPDEKLVIAGGAGFAIAGDVKVHKSPKLAEKICLAGLVSQPCLEGLLDQAACIVLPLTQGGGTNLKTAEALWSGRHIVATTIAMRGFEHFMNAKGVQVADEPAEFKRALRKAMSAEPIQLSPYEQDQRRTVLWEHCLSTLVQHVNQIGLQK